MAEYCRRLVGCVRWAVVCAGLAGMGCCAAGTRGPTSLEIADTPLPRELSKVSLPDYVIEPPDVLLVEALNIVPKPPYRIGHLDTLAISAAGVFPEYPISGPYLVDPEGNVRLGPKYGSVKVLGLTIDEAREAILEKLKETVMDPDVSVELAQMQGLQQITGEHLVRPDGTIALGRYGAVRVVGMTLTEAKQAIESQLAAHLEKPEVYVDVVEYNTKVCYLIVDGAGLGEQVVRFPITGNETVLDVIGQINGLPSVASKGRIWVARPAPPDSCADCGERLYGYVLPVDWVAITQCGATGTNYQVLPGDRIYINSDKVIAFTNLVNKTLAPVERIFGFSLLTTSLVRNFDFYNQFGRNIGRGLR